MESPGTYLRRERELRGVSLKDISEVVQVSLRLLEALERDDYEILPHPTYVKGFIRSYCKYLGLDENDAVLRFEVYLKEGPENVREGRAPTLEREFWSSSNTLMAILLAVGVLTVILFFVFLREPDVELVEPEGAPRVERMPAAKEEAEKEVPGAESPGQILEKMHTLEINATEVTWIRVVIDDGDPFEVLLDEGERIRWEASRVFFC
jgi:cytoskeletal protein RodZ